MKHVYKYLCALTFVAMLIPVVAHAASGDTCYYWGLTVGHTKNEISNGDTWVVLDVIELSRSQYDRKYLKKDIDDYGLGNLERAGLVKLLTERSYAYGSCYDSREKTEYSRKEYIRKLEDDIRGGAKDGKKRLIQLHGKWVD